MPTKNIPQYVTAMEKTFLDGKERKFCFPLSFLFVPFWSLRNKNGPKGVFFLWNQMLPCSTATLQQRRLFCSQYDWGIESHGLYWLEGSLVVQENAGSSSTLLQIENKVVQKSYVCWVSEDSDINKILALLPGVKQAYSGNSRLSWCFLD